MSAAKECRVEECPQGLAFTVRTTDRRSKQKSHFAIKYDTSGHSAAKAVATKTGVDVFRQQPNSRESFDRFGDDLCELILSYLTLRQKFRFECVCRQWRRLVFSQQQRLVLCNHINRKIHPLLLIPATNDRVIYDSLDDLLSINLDNDTPRYTISAEFLEKVLYKCRNITQIYINFNKKFNDDNQWYAIDAPFLDVILASGLRLKKFTLCSDAFEVNDELMARFGQTFAKHLTELRFKYISSHSTRQALLSETFPTLKKLDFNSVERVFSEDMARDVFADGKRFPKLCHLKYTFGGFDGLRSVCECRLTTLDIVLDTEGCPQLCGSGVDRALAAISQVKSLQVFNIKIFIEDLEISAIDNGLTKIADNCLEVKRIDFIMDTIVLKRKLFDVFSRFRSLEFFEISIEFNEDLEDYGSLESLKMCPNIRVLNLYLYNLSDKHLVDIDRHIPNITNFHLKSAKGITDQTITYLKKCPKLQVFEIHTYDDSKTRVSITDTAISQLIKSCPKLRIVYLFSRQKNLCFEKTIQAMISQSRLRPKVRHCFGTNAMTEVLKRLAEKRRKSSESSLLLPTNLWLFGLPNFERVYSFDYYSNHDL